MNNSRARKAASTSLDSVCLPSRVPNLQFHKAPRSQPLLMYISAFTSAASETLSLESMHFMESL